MKKKNLDFLKGKRVLFLGIEFYNYHEKIEKSLEHFGAQVDFFPIIKRGLRNSFILLFGKRIHNWYLSNFGNRIIHHIESINYDYVFVIQGWQQNHIFWSKLKKQLPTSIFLMYQWDSISPSHMYLPLVKYFDKVFTYDPVDAKNNIELIYEPLFYIDEYNQKDDIKRYYYDLLFIGNIRSFKERYYYVRKLIDYSEKNNLKIFVHLFADYKFYIKNLLKGIRLKHVKLTSLKGGKIAELFRKSKVVIDFHDPKKNGLTMRSVETLGAHKKLLTTNKNILYEPFYSDKIIRVIDPSNFEIDKDFVKRPSREVDFKLIKRHAINEWLIRIFN